MPVEMLDNKVKPEIAADPFVFSANGDIEIFAAGEQKEKDSIRLTLYDGSVIKHWYWGNLAFDLKTMKLAKKRIPILDAHETDRPLGYSTGASFDGKFILEGKFLKNNKLAAERNSEIEEGFPYEASLRFDMAKTNIEFVRENNSIEVNGKTLRGPGTVMRNAVIMEGSICVFGALNNCKTEKFENVLARFSERTEQMSDKKELTLDTFKAEYSQLHKEVFDAGIAEGEKKERDLFKELKTACGDDAALLVEMYEQGKTSQEALMEKNKKLQKQIEEFRNRKPDEKKEGQKNVDPAVQEFSDQQRETKAGENTEKTEDDLKAEFKASADLQAEFGSEEVYLAYCRAEKNGQVRNKTKK
jgi:hypothetical protein